MNRLAVMSNLFVTRIVWSEMRRQSNHIVPCLDLTLSDLPLELSPGHSTSLVRFVHTIVFILKLKWR